MKKLTAKQRELQQQFEKMMALHSKPLERGARAKAVKGKATKVEKRGATLLESSRTNRQASLDTGYNSTAPRQQIMYSGDKVMGVALMHKSTYAPVFNKAGAEEISRMKR